MADRTEREFSSQAPARYVGDFLSQGIFPFLGGFLQDQFRNIGAPDATPFTYTGERIAQFDPREQYAMELSDAAIGSYRPFIRDASDIFSTGVEDLRNIQGAGLGAFGEAGAAAQAGRGDFDPTTVSSFQNPFEDQVVQQTLSDISEGLAKSDIGLRDRAIDAGAFGGSRGRLTQQDLAERVGRGATEAVGAIRSKGFQDNIRNALTSFEGARRRDQGAGQLFSNIGSGLGSLGNVGAAGLSRFGSGMQSLGGLLSGLQGQDINRTLGIGSLGRGRNQSELDRAYSDFVGTYNLPLTTLSNVGSVVSALGPMAGGFGFAGSSAPQDFGVSGQPFYPNQTMGTVGANFYGGGMGGMGGMGGIGSFSNMYGTTAGTNTYGMNMPIM
tara:strand:- start:1978 stop:3129 length:1152 start_codon:yes stop_codon:yes gene_type:complete